MRFLTISEFTDRIGLEELSQIAGLGSLNSPQGRSLNIPLITSAIDFADDLLIGYARSRYGRISTLSPIETPDLVKGLISDVARYRLRSRSGGQGQVSEEVRKRYEDAIAFLKDVAKGKAELPLEGEPINGEASGRVIGDTGVSPVPAILHGWRP